MPTALAVAEYILTLSDPDEGDAISNPKLQKLLYYCQGFYLAIHGQPLFPEVIENWVTQGPVAPSVYLKYKQYEENSLPVPANYDFTQLTDEEKSVVNQVYDEFGQFSAWKLLMMIRQEDPWLDTEAYEPISNNLFKRYFKTQLIE